MSSTQELILRIGDLIDILITIVAGVALLAFFWGLAKFIFRVGGDEKAVEEGKRIMLWGLVALFVMISVWGIVNFIQNELNLPTTPIRNNSTTPLEWDNMPPCAPYGVPSRTGRPCL